MKIQAQVFWVVTPCVVAVRITLDGVTTQKTSNWSSY